MWSRDEEIHERDVARGAKEAKEEMEKNAPNMQLKHDPTKGINMNAANAAQVNE